MEKKENSVVFPKSDPPHMPELLIPISKISELWIFYTLNTNSTHHFAVQYGGCFFFALAIQSQVLTEVCLRVFSSEDTQSTSS